MSFFVATFPYALFDYDDYLSNLCVAVWTEKKKNYLRCATKGSTQWNEITRSGRIIRKLFFMHASTQNQVNKVVYRSLHERLEQKKTFAKEEK